VHASATGLGCGARHGIDLFHRKAANGALLGLLVSGVDGGVVHETAPLNAIVLGITPLIRFTLLLSEQVVNPVGWRYALGVVAMTTSRGARPRCGKERNPSDLSDARALGSPMLAAMPTMPAILFNDATTRETALMLVLVAFSAPKSPHKDRSSGPCSTSSIP